MDVSFNGSDRYKQKVSRPESVNSYTYPKARTKPRFVIKIWAACCLAPRIRFPIAILKKETLEDKDTLKELLDPADKENKEDCEYLQQQVLISGTPANARLASINAETRSRPFSIHQRRNSQPKRARRKRLEREETISSSGAATKAL